MDSWARLSLYESTDLVKSLFHKRHSRTLNTGKAQEIVSALAQGREYFTAAADAGLLVRPVLQYYGVLALSRGLILLLSPNLRETALPQAHGLSSSGWGANLSDKKPGELSVAVNKGTFLSLMEHTGNFDTPWVYTGPYPSKLILARSYPTTSLADIRITFEDVLSRTPELREIFEKTFQKSASNYRSFMFTIGDALTDIDVFPGVHGLPDEATLRQQLTIPTSVEIVHTLHHNFVYTDGHYRYRLIHPTDSSWIEFLPQFENVSETYSALISPFQNNIHISKIGRYFLLAFFLGTLSRYHPTHWLGMMQGQQNGDFIMPAIREVMNIVQANYCTLIIRELEGLS
ncbi:hypothetical protein PS874_04265 [Pseudomonas fluorescens]|nr:hypothetical protein PS874_04265 [Pseudomonas fluorescens]